MVLKKNLGNNIKISFPDFWIAVNDIEEDLDQKTFGITSLKNLVDNLNITDLQRKINKVEATVKILNNQMQQQFDYCKLLDKLFATYSIQWGCHQGPKIQNWKLHFSKYQWYFPVHWFYMQSTCNRYSAG